MEQGNHLPAGAPKPSRSARSGAEAQEKRRLVIPTASIRRIVGQMPAGWTEGMVRADIRLRCDPKTWPQDAIRRAEDYAARYFARLKGAAA